MMKQLRRSLWQRFTAFWDHLFQFAEQRFTESLPPWAKTLRHGSDSRRFSKMPLLVEALEPRYLLTISCGTLSGTFSGPITGSIAFSGTISGGVIGTFSGDTGSGGTFSSTGIYNNGVIFSGSSGTFGGTVSGTSRSSSLNCGV
jgi:hypothetical protein